MTDVAPSADALIGQIYDDISAETPWQRALDGLRDAVGAQTLALQMTVDGRAEQTYFLAAGVRTAPEHIAEWEHRSHDQQISLALTPGRVLTCNNYLDHRPRDGFVELIRRYDVARGMSAPIAVINNAEYSLHALRPGRDDPFGEPEEALFARLLPHLARAIGLRAELAAARDNATAYGDALDRIGVGMIRIDSHRRVICSNNRAAAMARRCGLQIAGGLLGARDGRLAARLKDALSAAFSTDNPDGFRTALALDGGASALVRGTATQDSTIGRQIRGATLLIVANPTLDDHAVEGLRALYSLTATEAAVGVHLAMGRSPREIQEVMDIRYTTLRSHITQLFIKLDCTRQSELTRRLAILLPVLQ